MCEGKNTHGMSRKWRFFLVWELRVYSAMFFLSFLTVVKMIFSSVREKNTYRQEPESVCFFWLLTRIWWIDCNVFRPVNRVWFLKCAERKTHLARAWKCWEILPKLRGCAIFYQAVRVRMLVYFENGEDCLWPESGWPGSRDDVMAYCAHFCWLF